MVDDVSRKILPMPSSKHRRRRKQVGKDFKPTRDLTRNDPAYGMMCKECGRRRPWNKLDIKYEMQGKGIARLWFCIECGTMVREEMIE